MHNLKTKKLSAYLLLAVLFALQVVLLFPSTAAAITNYEIDQIEQKCQSAGATERDRAVCIERDTQRLRDCDSLAQATIEECRNTVAADLGITLGNAPLDFTSKPTCEAGQTPETDNCVDDITRCADGTPGIPTSDPAEPCIPFNPKEVTPLSENPIVIFAGRIIVFLSGGVGIILVFVTVIAGIRYTMAKGNAQETAAAKGMVEKVVISAVLYVFAFVIINWLIPGGLLNG